MQKLQEPNWLLSFVPASLSEQSIRTQELVHDACLYLLKLNIIRALVACVAGGARDCTAGVVRGGQTGARNVRGPERSRLPPHVPERLANRLRDAALPAIHWSARRSIYLSELLFIAVAHCNLSITFCPRSALPC